MGRTEQQLPSLMNKLRWVIPALIAVLGVGYTLVEHLLITPHPIASAHVLREAIITGTVGPTLAWVLLTWATRIARSRQQAEEALERRNRELVALNAVGEAASRSLDVDEVLQTALHRLVEVVDLEAAELRTLERAKLVLKSYYGVSPQFVSDEEILPLGQCLCGQCAAQGTSLLVGDLDAAGVPLTQPCIREGFRSVLAVPMKVQEQVVGVIHLASRHPHAFTPHDEQLLGAIGHQIAVAIENARLYAETERRVLQLETAGQVGRQMTSILDIDHLLKQVTDLIRESFDYYHVHIFLVDEARNEVVLREASGPAAAAIKEHGLRLRIGQDGIVGQVAMAGQPLMSNDVSREPRYRAHELVPETRAELAVPLQVGDRIVGVLDVQSNACDAFDDADVKTLQILADQIAVAMENARLFEEARQRFQAMTALHETSLDIASRLDSQQVLQAILKRAADLLGAEGGSLGIYEPETNLLRKIAIHNLPSKYKGAAVPLGEGVAGKVVETGEPLIVNDYMQWEGRSETFADSPLNALIGVPLRWQGEIIGCLDVLDRSERRPFAEQDIWLLSSFAELASIAIKNAELYSEVKGLSEDLEQRVARRTRQLAAAQSELAQKADQLQALLSKTIHLQEEERARIARDMHDSTTQLILGALYATQAARDGLDTNLAGAREYMAMVQQFLQQIEGEIRQTIHDLRPPILDAKGVVPAFKQYADRYEELTKTPCTVRVTGAPQRLADDAEVAIYRIVQEALQNVAVHAGASRVCVGIHFDSQTVRVTVEDDGRGFDSANLAHQGDDHFGLIGMHERASNIGARLQVHSAPGQGTRVVLHVPVQES
jgi:signal transduction histidine kinase